MSNASTIRKGGIEFPTKPTVKDYMDLHASPSVANRWFQYKTRSDEKNFLWRGTCTHCGNHTWGVLDEEDQAFLEEQMTSAYLARKFEVEEGDNPGTYVMCARCFDGNSIRRDAARDYVNAGTAATSARWQEWPEEIFKEHLDRIAKARAEMEAWAAVTATAPKQGAYVLVKGRQALSRFDRWTGKDTLRLVGESADVKADEVEACIAAIYGVPHERAVLLPSSGKKASVGSLQDWSGLQVRLKQEGGLSTRTTPNSVAVLVPVLNPEHEKIEDKVVRLEWEARRIQFLLHRRMVAEGVARQWCSEFDPILDSTGLAPRKNKVLLHVSGVVAVDRESLFTKEEIEEMQGYGWARTIASTQVQFTEITQVQETGQPLLS